MSGDYTRFTFKPRNNYSGVRMQQGRVMLDSDWNEEDEIGDRHWRAETMDIVGRGVIPRTDLDSDRVPSGFRIQWSGVNLAIGRGRAYVDGLLAENHGQETGTRHFDPPLAEERSAEAVLYLRQPYYPNPPAMPTGGRHLVYLDVWQREVTAVEDPNLIEKAVGVDTATRPQTVWQVKLLEVVPPDSSATRLRQVLCSTPDNDVPGWTALTRPSAGRLTTGSVAGSVLTDPCELGASGGFRGTENRLYRVEIHSVNTTTGEATFKWSRDNASVVSEVTTIDTTNPARSRLTVKRIGRDTVLRFKPGDWVEVTDDHRELNGQAGVMCQIAEPPDEVNQTILLDRAVPVTGAGAFNVTGPDHLTDSSRHTRLRLWHQSGIVRDAADVVVADLTTLAGTNSTPGTNPGVIPAVTTAGREIVLEDGVKVSFSLNPTDGDRFHVGDYWVFAARTVDGSVESLTDAPPRGIHHHYCRLALLTLPGTDVDDCRQFWPPERPSCDCTVCVTAQSHRSGLLTIQDAVNQVTRTPTRGGGKICLGPGDYLLSGPVIIDQANALQIVGKGMQTRLQHNAPAAAIQVTRAEQVALENLTVFSRGPGVSANDVMNITLRQVFIISDGETAEPSAVSLRSCYPATVEYCNFNRAANADSSQPDTAIRLSGLQYNTTIRHNWLEGACGVANDGALHVYDLSISDNFCRTSLRGVSLDYPTLHSAATRIEHNTIQGCGEAGIVAGGIVLNDESPGAHLDIESNHIATANEGSGILVATDDTRIVGNDIIRDPKLDTPSFPPGKNWLDKYGNSGHGIILDSLLNKGINRCQILSNRIRGVSGNGIYGPTLLASSPALASVVVSAMIKQNIIEGVGNGGIIIGSFSLIPKTQGTKGQTIVIENNLLSNIGRNASVTAIPIGIFVALIRQVSVLNNVITSVALGDSSPPYVVGIIVAACNTIRVAGNEVLDLGEAKDFRGFIAGIWVEALSFYNRPDFLFERVEVSDNIVRQISDLSAKDEFSGHCTALYINGALPSQQAGALPFQAPPPRLPRRKPLVAVHGNHFENRSNSELSNSVRISTNGVCTFTDNRCLVLANKDAFGVPVAEIRASAVIVSSNYFESPGESKGPDAVRIFLPGKMYNILGNIANGLIKVNNIPVPSAGTAVGDDLNVIVP